MREVILTEIELHGCPLNELTNRLGCERDHAYTRRMHTLLQLGLNPLDQSVRLTTARWAKDQRRIIDHGGSPTNARSPCGPSG